MNYATLKAELEDAKYTGLADQAAADLLNAPVEFIRVAV